MIRSDDEGDDGLFPEEDITAPDEDEEEPGSTMQASSDSLRSATTDLSSLMGLLTIDSAFFVAHDSVLEASHLSYQPQQTRIFSKCDPFVTVSYGYSLKTTFIR